VETRNASHLDLTYDAPLPAGIDVGGIVIERDYVFGEALTDVVEAAVPVAASAVEQALRERRQETLEGESIHA